MLMVAQWGRMALMKVFCNLSGQFQSWQKRGGGIHLWTGWSRK
jgi:hypothetical protein